MLDDAIMFCILFLLIVSGYSLYTLGYALGDNSMVLTFLIYTFVLDLVILRLIFCLVIFLLYKIQFYNRGISLKSFIVCEQEFQKFQ